MRALVVAAVLIAALAAAGAAAAGPTDTPGFTKAFSCSACHGRAGASRADAVPVLAGMPAWYFKKAIEDYAAGRRPSPEMEPFSKMVQTLGVDDIAAYFAAQPPARASDVSGTVSTTGGTVERSGRRSAAREGEASDRRDPSPSPLP